MIRVDNITTAITCAGNERVNDMYATALNILANTTNNEVFIHFNTEALSEEAVDRLKTLMHLAEHNSNILKPRFWPERTPLAHMHMHTIDQGTRKFWLSVDDDVFIPYKTLNLLNQTANQLYPNSLLYLYTFFEVINRRGYKDYHPQKIMLGKPTGNLLLEINQYARTPLHRNYEIPDSPEFITMKDLYCGSFMVNREYLCKRQDVLNELEDWKKGKRGVDKYICQAVTSRPQWIYGSTAYHTDCTRATIDNKLWTEDMDGGSIVP